ncbi:MAG: hypothetical protein A2255_03520, partial [Candidatus Melainabacteria bacterium RIFOXYA2_FULL_32_9]
DFKIAQKIIFLIVVLTLFMALIGFVGYFYNKAASRDIADLFDNNMQKIQLLYEARVQNRAIEAELNDLLTADNQYTRSLSITDLRRRNLELSNQILKYQKTDLTSFERESLATLINRFENVSNVVNRTTSLVVVGRIQDAASYFRTNREPFNNFAESLRNLISYNQQLALNIHQQNTVEFRQARIILLTILFFSIIISLILGLYIARLISDRLNNTVENVEKIAKGDFDVEFSAKSNDEIGKLNAALNLMAHRLDTTITREKLLRNIVLTTISSLDINEVLKTIVVETGKLFQADRCFFIEYDEKTQEFLPIKSEAVYLSSLDVKDVTGLKLTDVELAPFLKIIFEQRQPVAVDNVTEIDFPQATKDLHSRYNLKSHIGIPIFYREIPLGVLTIHYTRDYKHFTKDDIDLLTDIANQSAIVIYQAKLYNQIQEISKRERLLRSIIAEILKAETLEEAAYCITKEVIKLFDVDRVTVRPYDEEQKLFADIIGESRRNENIPSAKGKLFTQKEVDDFIAQKIFIEGKPFIINDVDNPEYPVAVRQTFKDLNIKSCAIVPIIYGETPLAEIALVNTESQRVWKQDELDLLIPIVQQISIGMHIFELNSKLKMALDTERNLRKLIMRMRELDDHNQIFNYILEELMNIYNVDRAIHLHYDKNHNLFAANEVIKSEELGSIKDQIVLYYGNIKEILPGVFDRAIIINNVDEDIEDIHLRNSIKNKNIQAFLLYPIFKTSLASKEKENNVAAIVGLIMLCSSAPRKWMSYEIVSLKLIIDTISSVYFEIESRKEIEQLRTNFIATLTHDLRSPIIAEQKALEFMLSRKPETLLREYSEFIEDIYKTNNELLRIVNNLLAVYHYESGRFELNFEEVKIKDLIDSAVKSVLPMAQDEGAEISINIIDNPEVKVDKNEINRVLVNLINNAIKHNPAGVKINIESKKTNDYVQIAVSDNGRGIPEPERPHIFEKYPAIKRKIGTGLGLYIAKQIVEMHDGKIWFESEIGKGSTFYFMLPIAKA